MGEFIKRFFCTPSRYLIVLGVLVLIILALFGPRLAPYDPVDIQLKEKLTPPGQAHWLGTDHLGRDLFSRIICGTRISLGAAIFVLVISVTSGTVIGVVSGYPGGLVDETIMRITDIFLAFPALILALAIASVLGPGLENAMLAIGVAWWPWYARLVRGMVLGIKEQEYIVAARCLGTPLWRIGFFHIIPNLITPVITQATLDMGSALVIASSLSFIGLGVQPPVPEWGAIISQARDYIFAAWWMGAFPGLAIFLTVYLFNAFGDAVNATLGGRIAA
jgi:peptide/nickel transport system permease protein